MTDGRDYLPSDEVITEHAYLVARGVRALALVGHAPADELAMLRIATRLEAISVPGTVPFVLDRGDGICDFGFAASRWAVDLFRWVSIDPSVPRVQCARVVGLLLGYSAEAIERFEQEAPARLFGDASSASPERATS